MALSKFIPLSPDPALVDGAAMSLAKFGHINEIVDEVNKVTGNNATVTQQTAISTAVTIDSYAGVITTVSATTAAGSNVAFTVNNSKVTSASKVLLTAVHIGAGVPVFTLDSINNGSFVIRIYNVHPSNAFNNLFKISFLVLD
jgi:hypothetical protein